MMDTRRLETKIGIRFEGEEFNRGERVIVVMSKFEIL